MGCRLLWVSETSVDNFKAFLLALPSHAVNALRSVHQMPCNLTSTLRPHAWSLWCLLNKWQWICFALCLARSPWHRHMLSAELRPVLLQCLEAWRMEGANPQPAERHGGAALHLQLF